MAINYHARVRGIESLADLQQQPLWVLDIDKHNQF
jgi:hypothetical protein